MAAGGHLRHIKTVTGLLVDVMFFSNEHGTNRDNKQQIFILKNCRFKNTCNDDNSIGRRKQQKLAYHIVTCKFPIISLQCHDVLTAADAL